MQRAQARLDGWDRRLSECGRNLYRLHHAGFPRQVNAVHAQAAGISAVVLAGTSVDMVRVLGTEARFDTVALTGGVFQNSILLEQVATGLRESGFKVINHRQVPANDGGLSLGQAAIACARVRKADNSARSTGRLVTSESRVEEQASV